MKPEPIIEVKESILFWAFRYCLGRRTYAVSDCVGEIVKHWSNLSPKTQAVILRDIGDALTTGRAGMDMDIDQWLRIMELGKVYSCNCHWDEGTWAYTPGCPIHDRTARIASLNDLGGITDGKRPNTP